jgi:hypothetical protein
VLSFDPRYRGVFNLEYTEMAQPSGLLKHPLKPSGSESRPLASPQ